MSRRADSLSDVCARLNEAGLRAATAGSAAAAEIAVQDLRIDAVLADLGDGRREEYRRLAAALRDRGDTRPLVAALLPEDSEPAPDGAFDLVIRQPCHARQVCARLQEGLRLSVQEAEARLRRLTLAELGAPPPPPPEPAGRPAVLFVGSADPAFMGLRAALDGSEVETVAAFTSFTAFDYLHDRVFHAVVLAALAGNEPAFTICSAMRRNTRLFHVPALLLVDPARFDAADEAFARGASDILSTAAPPAETRDRVLSLAAERQRELASRAAFDLARDPSVLDRATGLFNRASFGMHLARMAQWAAKTDKPLSVIVLRAQPSVFADRPAAPDALSAARRQFGSLLRHLVRAEDFAARLDTGVFAIAMPSTTLEEARAASKRVRSAAGCASFSGSEDGSMRLALHASSATLQAGETGARMLKRAVDGFGLRPSSQPKTAAS